MHTLNLRSFSRALLLIGLASFVLGCDSSSNDQPRAIIISRPSDSAAFLPTATAPLPTAAPLKPSTATPPSLPSATPTLSPEIAEYQAVLQYWNSSVALTNQISDDYNAYVATTMPYDTFDEYVQHKDVIVTASDKLVTVIDTNLARLQALNPPPRAVAYHNATVQYLQEQRAYISDLRQAIDHNDIDLWNQGVTRWDKLQSLSDTRMTARHKLYEDYIATWRAK